MKSEREKEKKKKANTPAASESYLNMLFFPFAPRDFFLRRRRRRRHCCLFSRLFVLVLRMARGTAKHPSRQISHTRLYDETTIEQRYERLNKLGEGSFGTVYRVKGKDNQLFYAMKTIAKKVRSDFLSLCPLDYFSTLSTEVGRRRCFSITK